MMFNSMTNSISNRSNMSNRSSRSKRSNSACVSICFYY